MAHKKGLGSSRNGRDSNPQMLGVKMFAGQDVSPAAAVAAVRPALGHELLPAEAQAAVAAAPGLDPNPRPVVEHGSSRPQSGRGRTLRQNRRRRS